MRGLQARACSFCGKAEDKVESLERGRFHLQ